MASKVKAEKSKLEKKNPTKEVLPRKERKAFNLIKWLGSLPFGAKLLLISLPLLALGLFEFGRGLRNTNAQLAKQRSQVVGLRNLEQVINIYESLSLHRIWAINSIYKFPNAKAKEKEYADLVDKSLAAFLSQTQKQSDPEGLITQQIQEFSDGWEEIKLGMSEGGYPNADDIEAAEAPLVSENLAPIIYTIVNRGIVGPTSNSSEYFMLQNLTRNIPQIVDALLSINTIGMEVFTRKIPTAQDRTDLRTYQALMTSGQTRLVDDSVSAIEFLGEDAQGELLATFDGEDISQDVTQFNAIIANHILRPDLLRTTYDPITFNETSELVVKSLFGAARSLIGNRVGVAEQSNTRASLSRLLLSLLYLVGLGLALALAYWIVRMLTNQINSIVTTMNRVGRGDLSTLAVVETNDELGTLGTSVNESVTRLRGMVQTEQERDQERDQREKLQSNINEFLGVAMDISQGDFTKRGVVTEDVLGNVVDAINLMVEETSYLLKDVQATANEVNSAAENLDGITQVIAGGSREQAQEVVQVRGQTQQVAQSMNQMAAQADTSATAAQGTLEASSRGQEALTNTLNGMQSIRREVQNIAKSMKGLSDRSQEISEVVETIDAIAKQTNLLALNASLEAAGAGEAGARFAVVAKQVRKLAEDTAKSAQRVNGLVKGIQTEIEGVGISVDGGTKEVEQGFQIATEANERLKEIAALATTSSDLAKLISQAAKEQVQSVTQVGTSVETISETALRSEAESDRGKTAAESLRRLAVQLSESLGRFRLPS